MRLGKAVLDFFRAPFLCLASSLLCISLVSAHFPTIYHDFCFFKWRIRKVKALNQDVHILYSFLQSVHGNWRNALFIHCSSCPHQQHPLCGGFLFSADADGHPILMPIEDFQRLSGERIDPDECIGHLKRHAFETTFALYLEWHTVSGETCPLLQLNTKNGCDCPDNPPR